MSIARATHGPQLPPTFVVSTRDPGRLGLGGRDQTFVVTDHGDPLMAASSHAGVGWGGPGHKRVRQGFEVPLDDRGQRAFAALRTGVDALAQAYQAVAPSSLRWRPVPLREDGGTVLDDLGPLAPNEVRVVRRDPMHEPAVAYATLDRETGGRAV
jgi:hypothetical protein